ncbi:hypothetical protein AI2905V1_2530 [Enterobacter cloacae]|nr:hypothetical protein AI2905V1_2530 [Enterobacter cloacae]CAH5881355.1 hypothetical protein AI2905V1_2530 [Enterobacter cloacae]CAH5904543.1 hypothetical protein AI2916V1_3326 [Enterobacter cloacae]
MEKITTFIAYWLAVGLAYVGAMSPEKMALYVGGGCAIFTALTNYWFKRKTYLYPALTEPEVMRLEASDLILFAGKVVGFLSPSSAR